MFKNCHISSYLYLNPRFVKKQTSVRFQPAIGMLFYCTSGCQISFKSDVCLLGVMTWYQFLFGGRQPRWVSFGVTADYQRGVFCNLSSVLKSVIGRINIAPEILRCVRCNVLGWNCLFTPLFGGVLAAHFFHITSSIVPTHKRTIIWIKNVVCAI